VLRGRLNNPYYSTLPLGCDYSRSRIYVYGIINIDGAAHQA